jgi:hypothetical protein
MEIKHEEDRFFTSLSRSERNWRKRPFCIELDANVERVYIRVNLPATCADARMTRLACAQF